MKTIIILFLITVSVSASSQSFYRFKTKKVKSQPYVYYAPRGEEKEMKSAAKYQYKKHKFRKSIRVKRANYNAKRRAIKKQIKGLNSR